MSQPALLHSRSALLPSTSRASPPSPLHLRRTRRRRCGVVMASSTTAPAPAGLKEGIAGLYDESSGVWESIWGDHMHHGFYDSGEAASMADHRRAQIRMIEEALAFAAVSDDPAKKPKTIVDVGCGIGGSSRYLAKKYGAQSRGITLSPVQAERGNALAAAEGLSDKVAANVSLQVADALEQPFPDGQFDLVWSMESGEHMPDKRKDIKTADWSENVAPFWPAVIKSALTWKGLTSLLKAGWKTIRGAMVMPLMIEGYKKGLIKFTIITCRKPGAV
ncbi:hypothetical protein PR202_ga02414 [Eleusine coracana subsp. coracana]|uniref:Methyltransferase domain-containing protein n=1 Tax=Eleusine coracana subsp. coracana TaxID=191504 RepID=A0AAV5BLK0_ELECO|nr:hypothetical protein PR202_ga02414 [Eleusine coracana subsp. coracana]